MRFLCDEDTAVRLPHLIRALGDEADHVRDLGLSGTKDPDIAVVARGYDVLITIDLHRDEIDWFAMYESLISEIRIVRMRFPPKEKPDLFAQARSLIYRWKDWTYALSEEGMRLVTLRTQGTILSRMSALEVDQLLATRLPHGGSPSLDAGPSTGAEGP